MSQSKLTLILVDDEKMAIENLTQLITTYCPSIKIISTANSVADAQSKINILKPEVVFLDVNMPGQNGFELLKMLTYTPLIVFVTAHQKYALQAMKACAVDFILKPIDIDELILTEKKLLQLHSISKLVAQNYKEVLTNLTSILEKKENITKITLSDTNGYEIVEIASILYLIGEDNYTTIFLNNNIKKVISKTLKNYEEILEPHGFMRIHKSSLINLTQIKEVKPLEVIMSNGQTIKVSRRRTSQLLEWVKSN